MSAANQRMLRLTALLLAWLSSCIAVVSPPIFTRRSLGAAAGAAIFGGAPHALLSPAAAVATPAVAAPEAAAAGILRTAPTRPGVLSPLCDPSVSVIRFPATGQTVILVGTAHISEDSASLVRLVRLDG